MLFSNRKLVVSLYVIMFLGGPEVFQLHAQQTQVTTTNTAPALFDSKEEANKAFWAGTYSEYMPEQRAIHPVSGTEKRCETVIFVEILTPHGWKWAIRLVGSHLLFNEVGNPVGDPRCKNPIRRWAYPSTPPETKVTKGEKGDKGDKGDPGPGITQEELDAATRKYVSDHPPKDNTVAPPKGNWYTHCWRDDPWKTFFVHLGAIYLGERAFHKDSPKATTIKGDGNNL